MTDPALRGGRRGLLLRIGLLSLMAIALYVVWPSIVGELNALPSLTSIDPVWLVPMFALEAASLACFWQLERLLLGSTRWFAIATAQLSGNAVAKVLPGGAATGGALQYRMLVHVGERPGEVATAVATADVIDAVTVLALPVLALPAILGGSGAAPGLANAALLGAGTLMVALVAALALLRSDRLVRGVATFVERFRGRLHRPPDDGLAGRLLRRRDDLRTTLRARWRPSLAAASGNWAFDFLALITAIAAVDEGFPNPGLVLLAYVAAQVMVVLSPTPGGIGFVEATLTGFLVLAGVPHGSAVLATLAYRLASFWLPMPAGGIAYLLFRHRYGDARQARAPTAGSMPG